MPDEEKRSEFRYFTAYYTHVKIACISCYKVVAWTMLKQHCYHASAALFQKYCSALFQKYCWSIIKQQLRLFMAVVNRENCIDRTIMTCLFQLVNKLLQLTEQCCNNIVNMTEQHCWQHCPCWPAQRSSSIFTCVQYKQAGLKSGW